MPLQKSTANEEDLACDGVFIWGRCIQNNKNKQQNFPTFEPGFEKGNFEAKKPNTLSLINDADP